MCVIDRTLHQEHAGLLGEREEEVTSERRERERVMSSREKTKKRERERECVWYGHNCFSGRNGQLGSLLLFKEFSLEKKANILAVKHSNNNFVNLQKLSKVFHRTRQTLYTPLHCFFLRHANTHTTTTTPSFIPSINSESGIH